MQAQSYYFGVVGVVVVSAFGHSCFETFTIPVWISELASKNRAAKNSSLYMKIYLILYLIIRFMSPKIFKLAILHFLKLFLIFIKFLIQIKKFDLLKKIMSLFGNNPANTGGLFSNIN